MIRLTPKAQNFKSDTVNLPKKRFFNYCYSEENYGIHLRVLKMHEFNNR